MVGTVKKLLNVSAEEYCRFPPRPEPPKMTKRDWACLLALLIVASVLSFYRLGDTQSPQTSWVASEENNRVEIDLGDVVFIEQFQFFLGAQHHVPFSLYGSSDGVTWEQIFIQEWETFDSEEFYFALSYGYVFSWIFEPINSYARYVALYAENNLRLGEIGFRGVDGEILEVKGVSFGADALVDEQNILPFASSLLNSTYTDEAYYARTGYEMLHGYVPFERTHPPLGKVFISVSIWLLGNTPFAWRLPGVLFGLSMIPLLYTFSRRIFNSNNLALLSAFFLTFDFMIFARSRMAAIDAPVTFFILAMFYLMYLFVRGIERNSFIKSLSLLGLCGMVMGFGIATKWQGVFGALGLPFLFFPALYRLYLHNKKQAMIMFCACFGFFVLIPFVIYLFSYIPYANAEGMGLFRTMWENQVYMLTLHGYTSVMYTNWNMSDWWSWFAMVNPFIAYYPTTKDGSVAVIAHFGNPVVWWLGTLTLFSALYRYKTILKHKCKDIAEFMYEKKDTAFLFIAFGANMLPWVFIARFTFIYHYMPSVPSVVLFLVMFLKNKSRLTQYFVAVAALVLFIIFYPVLSGLPVSESYIANYLQWFETWVFTPYSFDRVMGRL